jgi:AraC-like DNA-binding protein
VKVIEYQARSAGAWEALCIEQFQLCSVDWAAPSFGAGIRATADIPNLSLHLVTSGPFGVSRSHVHARRHDSDDLMVVFQDRGSEGRVEHRGERSMLGAGDAVLIDTRRPYLFDFPAPVQQTVLKIPRATAGRLDAEAGRVVRAFGSPLGKVLRVIFRELADLGSEANAGSSGGSPAGVPDSTHAIEAASMTTAAVDLLAAIYAADPSHNAGLLGHEALLRSAQDFVGSRFRDPRLSPALIARHLSVSPRLVAQIFADAGSSPAAYIRDVRLNEAARLLQSQMYRNAPIFNIGLRVGFPEATTFARAFKRARGMAPSEFRSASPDDQVA